MVFMALMRKFVVPISRRTCKHLLSSVYQVVDDFSSIIGDAAEAQEGIDANHVQMCKFTSRDDPGYKKVFRVIRDLVKDSDRKASQGTDDNALETGKHDE